MEAYTYWQAASVLQTPTAFLEPGHNLCKTGVPGLPVPEGPGCSRAPAERLIVRFFVDRRLATFLGIRAGIKLRATAFRGPLASRIGCPNG